ncbi:MAG: 30S ribosomal protein S1 [Treponema sp.]
MVIAIDGPAGSGKSTIAKLLSERLHAVFMNTGSFYRALTYTLLQETKKNNISIDTLSEEYITTFARTLNVGYDDGKISIDRVDVSPFLRSDEIEKYVSSISSFPCVRKEINKKIQKACEGLDIVSEGRDATTVIFPNADVKIYLDADVETRARRRFEQGTSNMTLDELVLSIKERDEKDKNKKEGSLIKSKDALYYDTSHLTIKEVYDIIINTLYNKGLYMKRKEVATEARVSDESIQALKKEYDNFETPEVGTIKAGRIVAISGGIVFVDVGGKSEGHIPLEEFDEEPKVGEDVDVYIVRTEGNNGVLEVSKKKADRVRVQLAIDEAYKNGTPIAGTIAELSKSGYRVRLGADIMAFLPMSQADTQRVEEPESLLKEKSFFYIEKMSYNKKNNEYNIVVNRRKYLEEVAEKTREEFFKTAQIGDTVEGTVKSFTSFGCFVDLNGFDGLLHVNDMSWGHVARPRDFVKKGDKIQLKVIRLEPDTKRINLSLKHFTPDPWLDFENKFSVNDVVTGTVTKITDFGAFIELAEGIEGLAHISEFSWVKKINKPEDLLRIGDNVQCMVLGYDIQAGRVSLGLKQITANPWDSIEERYPVGTRLSREVVKITNAGAFIKLEEGIDGFLHVDDISWTKRVKNPSKELEVGKTIDVIVIECNAENRRIKLGIKQLTDDPWKVFANTYKIGSVVEGEVTSITDFGLFLKVPGDIEGLVHKQNLVENKGDVPDEALAKYKVGDKVKAVVMEVHPKMQKATFSVKDLKKKEQQAEISKYMSSSQEDDGPYTLGDLLKTKKS